MVVGTELITSNAGIVGLFTLLITLSVSLAKVVEFLIKKALPVKNTLSETEFDKIKDTYALVETALKKIDEDSNSLEEQHEWVHQLYRLHSKLDRDGIPLFYFPRSFIDTQKEIISILSSMSSQMDKSTYVLDSLLKHIDDVEKQLHVCEKTKCSR